jgi:hypothetical protein
MKDRIKIAFFVTEALLMVVSAVYLILHLSNGDLLDALVAFIAFFTCFVLLYKDMDEMEP